MGKKLKLRDYQREDVEFLKKHNLRALIASAPGTGKTATAIKAIVETEGARPVLVVCPASVVRNWGREIKAWSPSSSVLLVDDMTTPIPRLRAGDLFVICSWSLLDGRVEEFSQVPFRTIVADEVHYAKSTETLRHQALADLVPGVRHVLLLSGTPLVNRREELEVLHTFLGEGEPPMLRRVLEDVAPDVPPKSRAYLNIRLPEKWAKEYEKADSDFANWLAVEKAKQLGLGASEEDVERILANEALVKIGYLRRIAGEGKVAAAVDWICRAVRVGEPVVVFLEHQAVLERLARGLTKNKVKHVVLDGNATAKQRQEAVDAFQRYEIPVFIGTRAAKEGITLTAARHLLFVERFWTSADEEQAEDRIRRIGQRSPTTVWFLHALDTVDDRVDEIVKTKRKVVREAIGSPDIEETAARNVEAMLHQWGQAKAEGEERTAVPLGEGEGLPPLPSPTNTHGIVFSTTRWNHAAALAWCKMHGFVPSRLELMRKVDYDGRFKLVLHPEQVFRRGSFTAFRVSADIRILVGKRLGKSEGRRMRNYLHRLREESSR